MGNKNLILILSILGMTSIVLAFVVLVGCFFVTDAEISRLLFMLFSIFGLLGSLIIFSDVVAIFILFYEEKSERMGRSKQITQLIPLMSTIAKTNELLSTMVVTKKD